jgi:pimeloyl-ACP methyl ester carboxylesterase
VSYGRSGSGPPLVLVHGSFSDHVTNWEFVAPLFERRFTVFAVARRGRGETPATTGHTLGDEAADVAAVVRAVGEPVFLLGHSYGAHAALAAATEVPDLVRKLVLYEAPLPALADPGVMAKLEALGQARNWDALAATFFRDALTVPAGEVAALRETLLWPPIVADATASLGDIRAFTRYDFRAERFAGLRVPTLLQAGTESPRHLYTTDALASALPDVRVAELPGQAHEGMTTAPELYTAAVIRFLFE